MKQLLMTIAIVAITGTSYAQTATYKQVQTKEVKGTIMEYIAEDGTHYKVGDSLRIGSPQSNEHFDLIIQNAVIAQYPLPSWAASSYVVIKSIKAWMRTAQVTTTRPTNGVYQLYISNLEAAVKAGEIRSLGMTKEEALAQLKEEKDKYDLGLITEEEFNAKREELKPFILK